MNLAVISVCALAFAVLVSCVSRLNVGVLSLALAWIVGVYIGGMPVTAVMSGFPSQLFLTLTGVTLLFAMAQCNGTLERLAHQAVRLCRGNCGTIPVMFFVLAAALASIGPGNIATAALLAPLAMATAVRSGIPLFLMAIMVGDGANAGALSPIAPTGIIVNGLMARNGLPGFAAQTYLYNLAAHSIVAFAGYAMFGGLKLFGVSRATSSGEACASGAIEAAKPATDLRIAPLNHDRHHLGADRRRHRLRRPRRHGRVPRRRHPRPQRGGGRWRGGQADAVARDRHGLRRDGAHLAGRKGRRASIWSWPGRQHRVSPPPSPPSSRS